MARRDYHHDIVRDALIADGWVITDDPLRLYYGGRNLYVDLGAEYPIAAEKEGRRIAVEIKGFLSESDVYDFSSSLGQYRVYQHILEDTKSDRVLYLAIPNYVYTSIFQEPLGQLVLRKDRVQLIVFDEISRRVEQWIT